MSFSVTVNISDSMERAMDIRRSQVAVLQGMKLAGLAMKKTIKAGIKGGPKTGRIYNFKGRKHRSSAPGEYPANRSGALLKSISFRVENATKLEVGSQDIKYAPILQQFKTPTQRTSNWRKIAPRPFLTLAHDENAPFFPMIMANVIQKELGI